MAKGPSFSRLQILDFQKLVANFCARAFHLFLQRSLRKTHAVTTTLQFAAGKRR